MDSTFFNPQLLLTFIGGAWQLGNIVSIAYIMFALRRQAKAETTTTQEADKLFRDYAMKELVPRLGIYFVGTIVIQVLINIFG